jgi:lysophospholipase L1-like esterase
MGAVVAAVARSRALMAPAPVAPVSGPRTAAPPPPAAAPPAASVPAPAAANPIVALGDSLTFGWGKGASPIPFGPAPVRSYPWYLERALSIPVVNAGITGTTAHEVLDPASEPNHPRPESLQLPALLALHPRLMIVSFGSNEVQRGWPVWQTAADLDRILSRVTATGVPVVLVGTHVDCSVDPCQGPASGYSRQRYLSNWDAALTQLATRYQAGLVLDLERGFTRDDLTDWIHPTASGYSRMAQRIEPAAVSVLQRQAQRSPGAHPAPRLPDGGWSPPARPAPGPGSPPEEPRPQSEMWPGGPHEFLPWNLERVLSLLGDMGVTSPRGAVTWALPENVNS